MNLKDTLYSITSVPVFKAQAAHDAREVERLRALNAELAAALNDIASYGSDWSRARARAALAKQGGRP